MYFVLAPSAFFGLVFGYYFSHSFTFKLSPYIKWVSCNNGVLFLSNMKTSVVHWVHLDLSHLMLWMYLNLGRSFCFLFVLVLVVVPILPLSCTFWMYYLNVFITIPFKFKFIFKKKTPVAYFFPGSSITTYILYSPVTVNFSF